MPVRGLRIKPSHKDHSANSLGQAYYADRSQRYYMKSIIRLLLQLAGISRERHTQGGEMCKLLEGISGQLATLQTTLAAVLAELQAEDTGGGGTPGAPPEDTAGILAATASLKSHADALTSATAAAEASESPTTQQP
jgi:hypothetical protein